MSFRVITHTMALAFLGLALTGCSSPEEKEAKYLKRGNHLFEDGQYDQARIEYMNAGRIKPTDSEVAYRLGLVDEAQGNLHGAFVNFQHAEQQNAHHDPALLKLASFYLAAGHPDEAQSRIEVVMSDLPNDAEAHALRAALMLQQKNLPETEKEARFALSQDANNATAYTVLTGLYSTQGDVAKAEAATNEGITHNPKNLALLLLKARVDQATNNLPGLQDAYKAIFKLKPMEGIYHIQLATTEMKMGKAEEAEATLREGVAALPNDWSMRHQLVLFLDKIRGASAAEQEIIASIKANPEHDELYSWLVDLYTEHSNLDRATELLNEILSHNPSDKQVYAARTSLARIAYIKGDKDTADKLTKDVLEKDPNNLDALFIKARIEVDKGNYRDAIVDLRSIIRDRPKTVQAMQILSEALVMQGHLDLAIDTVKQLLEVDPSNTGAKVRLAQLYSLNGDSKRAMDMLFLITKSNPDYAVAWEATARVAVDTKDWSTADMAINKLDALPGQHPLAAFLRGEVFMKNGKAEQAIPEFKKVIEADITSALAERSMANLVSSYRSVHRLEEAAHYIEGLKSETPFIDTALSEVYVDLGKPDVAAATLDKAIANHSKYPETYMDRATLYARERKTDQAIDILKKGMDVAPADIRPLVMQGEIYAQTGHPAEAVTVYDQLLTRNPELNVIANNMAEVIADYEYNDTAALEKARQAAERFVTSSDPLLLDTLAWVYYRQGDNVQAQTVMERAIAQGSTKLPPQVHYHYGAILAKAGNAEKAKAELQQAVVKGAAYPGLDDARKLLTGL